MNMQGSAVVLICNNITFLNELIFVKTCTKLDLALNLGFSFINFVPSLTVRFECRRAHCGKNSTECDYFVVYLKPLLLG